MIQTLTKRWLPAAVCGAVEATISVIYLVMWGTDGPLTFYSWGGTVSLLGKIALAGGVCAMAAWIWRSASGRSWLLVLHGLALGALGLIQYALVRFRIRFLTVALLVILMAMSLAIVEWTTARGLWRRGHVAEGWFVALAGAVSVGFAFVFLALGFQWIEIVPGSHADLRWLGLYFGFSAICMLGLALRLHSESRSQAGWREVLPRFGVPGHAG